MKPYKQLQKEILANQKEFNYWENKIRDALHKIKTGVYTEKQALAEILIIIK